MDNGDVDESLYPALDRALARAHLAEAIELMGDDLYVLFGIDKPSK